MTKLYTTAQAAKKLGLCDRFYVTRLIKQEKLDAKKVGTEWLISEAALNEFMADRKIRKMGKQLNVI